ncbi:MAG: DedA family protein [Hymenobacteraceae bacterium]|nr:DedA family protein [Hymenobacteraceae bacterium]MDX5397604.1 DedA family protein [Hymenobacteraceae bacterium]MDX5443751.1 DedA family protein [Hymenobacteraceae bacterium]MDX5513684.1 DedA family protein [Hymenobacteraceae bacterium]
MSVLLTEPLFISSFSDVLQYGGLALIFLIIFIETAVVFGIFVPGGDSLLVTIGLLCSSNTLHFSLTELVITMIVAAVSGDMLGYYIGKGMGKHYLRKKKSRFIKPKHLKKAQEFYNRNGSLTFFAGRFLPVIRTFNPILSGTSGMQASRFFAYSLLSASFWIVSLLFVSYYTGIVFPQLSQYLHILIPAVVLLPVLPLLWNYVMQQRLQQS